MRTLDVEVRIKEGLEHDHKKLAGLLERSIRSRYKLSVPVNALLDLKEDYVVMAYTCEMEGTRVGGALLSDTQLRLHLFECVETNATDFAMTEDDPNQDLYEENPKDEDKVDAAELTPLPSAELLRTWEHLVYNIEYVPGEEGNDPYEAYETDDSGDHGKSSSKKTNDNKKSKEKKAAKADIKKQLLKYIHSSVRLSSAGVDKNLISWNRLILLYGPPGTGKTSLCKALAQKLSIQLRSTFPSTVLVEINSHSLFSKWFSESGKLVQKLFSSIFELLSDPTRFVVILIDEVESLTAARAGAMSGKEPSDALRVVNALLTQIDKIKTKENCLILTTSNLTKAMDPAFIDRADLKIQVGPPSREAIYHMLNETFLELERKSLCQYIDRRMIEDMTKDIFFGQYTGRFIRRLPLLAMAKMPGHVTFPATDEEWFTAVQEVMMSNVHDI